MTDGTASWLQGTRRCAPIRAWTVPALHAASRQIPRLGLDGRMDLGESAGWTYEWVERAFGRPHVQTGGGPGNVGEQADSDHAVQMQGL
jgi:hypothetical protein